jgi:hypothetical protein
MQRQHVNGCNPPCQRLSHSRYESVDLVLVQFTQCDGDALPLIHVQLFVYVNLAQQNGISRVFIESRI